MSNFTLKQDGYTGYTTIPNCFIEQFMPYAAGEFVKIYIYLLKCVNENRSELSISRIADAFNNTEKDVVRALKYWQKKGLLRLAFDENNALSSLAIIPLTDSSANAAEPEDNDTTFNVTDAPIPGNHSNNIKHTHEHKAEAQKVPERREYSKDEIAAFSMKDEVAELLFIAARYLGKNLTARETDTVLYFYDTLGFPAELIEYLFEYCVGKNHNNMRYIEKTALGWAEAGVKTVKAAKLQSGIYSGDCSKVMSAFGLSGRNPVKSEIDFVTRWLLSYGFDINLIVAACEKTMEKLHRPNFEYTDGILKNWKERGVACIDDVFRLDREFEIASEKSGRKGVVRMKSNKAAAASRFNNFSQRTYDYRELEQKLFSK